MNAGSLPAQLAAACSRHSFTSSRRAAAAAGSELPLPAIAREPRKADVPLVDGSRSTTAQWGRAAIREAPRNGHGSMRTTGLWEPPGPPRPWHGERSISGGIAWNYQHAAGLTEQNVSTNSCSRQKPSAPAVAGSGPPLAVCATHPRYRMRHMDWHSSSSNAAPRMHFSACAGIGVDAVDVDDPVALGMFPPAGDDMLSEQEVIGTGTTSCATLHATHAIHTPLSFRIPDDDFAVALETLSTPNPTFWSYAMYKDPVTNKSPVLHYCKTLKDSETVAQLFLGESVLGFDMEWASSGAKRGIKQNVSVIQLASETRCAIFHLALHSGETPEELLAPTLRRIIEDAGVAKVGVAIMGDCTRLRRCLGVNASALLELSHLHKLVTLWETPEEINRVPASLKDLVDTHLRLPLYKDNSIRTSEWDERLGRDQLRYAASDAYASVQLLSVLNGKRLALEPEAPPMPCFAELLHRVHLGVKEPARRAPRSRSRPPPTMESSKLEVDVTGAADELVDGADTTRSAAAESSIDEEGAARVLAEADRWVSSLAARSKAGQLRAYALWHRGGLPLKRVAALLRTPPLKPSTVASYILLAVHQDVLPFEAARMGELARAAAFVPAYLRSSQVLAPFLR